MSWEAHAERLAGEVTHPASRWRPVVGAVPRHLFTPAWWEKDASAGRPWHDRDGRTGWARRDAAAMPGRPYANKTLVTQVGMSHADHAGPGDTAEGQPTSSSTLPSLAVDMCRHAVIGDGMDVLDVGTGSGYGAALLATRLGEGCVTSADIDAYLVFAATGRLDEIGLHPMVAVTDATGPLNGDYDRIVSMMSVAPVPASWLAALRPGGRLVTTIAGTGLIVTADKAGDGGAKGRVEWHRAGFMQARSGPGYPPPLLDQHPEARDSDGDTVTASLHPVPRQWSWELNSNLALAVPGIEDHYEEGPGPFRFAWLLAPDGSWARAEQKGDGPTFVHQSGPRRLWDVLDGLRHHWLTEGSLPAYGSAVVIAPDGSITFSRGEWSATIPAKAPAVPS